MKTKYEIVDELASNSEVEKMVYKMLPASKNLFDQPRDLIQDVYVDLLDKDDLLIEDLYNRDELGYYILKMVRNQLFSVNSRYYYKYIRFGVQSEDLSKAKDKVYE